MRVLGVNLLQLIIFIFPRWMIEIVEISEPALVCEADVQLVGLALVLLTGVKGHDHVLEHDVTDVPLVNIVTLLLASHDSKVTRVLCVAEDRAIDKQILLLDDPACLDMSLTLVNHRQVNISTDVRHIFALRVEYAAITEVFIRAAEAPRVERQHEGDRNAREVVDRNIQIRQLRVNNEFLRRRRGHIVDWELAHDRLRRLQGPRAIINRLQVSEVALNRLRLVLAELDDRLVRYRRRDECRYHVVNVAVLLETVHEVVLPLALRHGEVRSNADVTTKLRAELVAGLSDRHRRGREVNGSIK